MSTILKAETNYTVVCEKTKTYIPLRIKEFDDEKEYKRFIKNTERLIRSSIEYKEFVNYCRETLGATECVFTHENLEETGDIELHHHPFTLYDICKIVADTKLYNDEPICTFDIAREVIELHFGLKVGIVPIAGTLHKKFHKGYLQIPIEYVIGDYKYIVENYEVDKPLLDKYLDYTRINKNNVEEFNKTWLNKYEVATGDSSRINQENIEKENNPVADLSLFDVINESKVKKEDDK